MCPSQCPICAQHVYKLGHSLYTEATAWPPLVHWSCIHACAQAWAHVYISKQFPSLGTPTFITVEVASEATLGRNPTEVFAQSYTYYSLNTRKYAKSWSSSSQCPKVLFQSRSMSCMSSRRVHEMGVISTLKKGLLKHESAQYLSQ